MGTTVTMPLATFEEWRMKIKNAELKKDQLSHAITAETISTILSSREVLYMDRTTLVRYAEDTAKRVIEKMGL